MIVHKLSFVAILAVATMSRADGHPHGGININVHDDGGVEVDGIGDYVDGQIDRALGNLDRANMPPAMREKLKAKLGQMRAKLAKRLRHLDAKDLDHLGEELDQWGEEFGREMESFGSDMDQWGKDFAKQFGKDAMKAWSKHMMAPGGHHGHMDADDDDDDDDASVNVAPAHDDDDDVDDDAVRDMGDLSLDHGQREQLSKLRAESDRQISAAKSALVNAKRQLRAQLENPSASDAEISRAIDAVSQQEAMIRKVKILTWHNARRLLDDTQRGKVEGAAKRRPH